MKLFDGRKNSADKAGEAPKTIRGKKMPTIIRPLGARLNEQEWYVEFEKAKKLTDEKGAKLLSVGELYGWLENDMKQEYKILRKWVRGLHAKMWSGTVVASPGLNESFPRIIEYVVDVSKDDVGYLDKKSDEHHPESRRYTLDTSDFKGEKGIALVLQPGTYDIIEDGADRVFIPTSEIIVVEKFVQSKKGKAGIDEQTGIPIDNGEELIRFGRETRDFVFPVAVMTDLALQFSVGTPRNAGITIAEFPLIPSSSATGSPEKQIQIAVPDDIKGLTAAAQESIGKLKGIVNESLLAPIEKLVIKVKESEKENK